MAISLGRSIAHPSYLLAQIVHAVSMYYVTLVVVRVLIHILTLHNQYKSLVIKPSGGFAQVLSTCFYVSVSSVFDGPVEAKVARGDASEFVVVKDSSAWQFFALHVLTSLLVAFPLAVTIQRRKFALDFVSTIFVSYFLLANVTLTRLYGGKIHWWVSTGCGMGVLHAATWYICKHREMQDIKLGNNNNTSSSGATSAPPPPACDMVAVEMEELLATERGSDDGSPNMSAQTVIMASPSPPPPPPPTAVVAPGCAMKKKGR